MLHPIHENIASLKPLLEHVLGVQTLSDKLGLLNAYPPVKKYLKEADAVRFFLGTQAEPVEYAIKAVIALGQGPLVFQNFSSQEGEKINALVAILLEVESFYKYMGGIIGYHVALLELIAAKDTKENVKRSYLQPVGMDLTNQDAKVRRAIRLGLEHLPEMAEIYPVGGAGDRLNLCEEATQEPLPAALLPFEGRTLLEGLFRDLQAREYLHYKLFGHQEVTPVAMMTSQEKQNEEHILAICERKGWFGRPPGSFKFFKQPLVPVITEEGDWALSEPLKLILKPGGHGVIWKLADEKGVFDWFKSHEREQMLVRQINNPVAGTDYGILAFLGEGCQESKAFGFASCPRLPKTAEGVNVLIETENADGFTYCLTNIEYTEFDSKGIEDTPRSAHDPYSVFPSNTNILFANISAIRKALKNLPIPGMLVNMKTKMCCIDREGNKKTIAAGRLESIMQNIADAIVDRFDEKLQDPGKLSSYITYNKRRKTISVTKSTYMAGASHVGTPEGCLYEMMANAEELLREHCHMTIPKMQSEADFLQHGPHLLFFYHPALGPLYSIIGQKLKRGTIKKNGELQLEIAELAVENLYLEGSLIIEAKQPLGPRDPSGLIIFGSECGKCLLRNVRVVNKGIDRNAANIYWKNQIQRHEELQILLHGNAEFVAENVTFHGKYFVEVPDGHRLVAVQEGQAVSFRTEKLTGHSLWKYSFNKDDAVIIT